MSETLSASLGQSVESVAAESIGSFAVKFDAGASSRSKVLYANGRMQVKVQVVVAGVDRDGNVVAVSDEVMEITMTAAKPCAMAGEPARSRAVSPWQ